MFDFNIVKRLRKSATTMNYQIYVFHHIPKCYGSSILVCLSNWFDLIHDYIILPGPGRASKIDLANLKGNNCLCGHYATYGDHIHQVYPDIINNDLYRMFTFVRDPLETKISLYYYEKKRGLPVKSLIESLFERPNYISKRFPCNIDNYKSVLDRYYFIGIAEHIQDSLDVFAGLIGKQPVCIGKENISARDDQIDQVTPTIVEKFKEENSLDYLIYNYCLEKYLDHKPKGQKNEY